MVLFFSLMLLFYVSEFTIHTSLPGSASKKLISNSEYLNVPKKVVLVIIDALRYDYINKFAFVSSTRASQPQHSFAVKCRVSLPTMTTQRVESLMTGS
jgi:predicted AlkP superfamily pyrophosphatase or phosphodiesterase